MLKVDWKDLETDVVLLQLEGSLDFDSEIYFKKILENIIGEGKYRLILDMTKVEYANSYGFNAISATLSKVRKMNGDIKLLNVRQNVFTLLQLVGFTKSFEFFNSLEKVLESYQKE